MKLIRPGRPTGAWSQEVLCTGKGSGGAGCYSLLLASAEDLFKTCSMGHQAHGVVEWFVTIKCPECGKLTDLGRIDYPQRTRVPLWIADRLLPRLAWEAQQAAKAATPQPEEHPR